MWSDALDAYAARVLDAGWAPAVAVGVTGPDRTLFARTYGAAEPDALWPIASIDKSFAAVIALQLSEEGALDLHAPVTAYVPWLTLGGDPSPVTVHHLLTHTAGVVANSDLAPASTYDVIALAGLPLGFAPGAHHHYSNVGYRAVGVVLEAVTGHSYAALLHTRVLDRVGMRDSAAVTVHDTRRRIPPGHAPFYDDRPWRPEHGLAPAPWVESAEADGCSCCTVEDLAAYLRAVWTGADLLSGASLERMKTPSPPVPDHGWVSGCGLDVHPDGFGHEGDMLGHVSYMRCDTAAGIGVVAFANGFGGAHTMGEAALAIARGDDPPDLPDDTAAPLEDDGTCPREWAPYLGRYRSHDPWQPTFLVAASEGSLVLGSDLLGWSERHPLCALGGGVFRVGAAAHSPERLRFDTVLGGRAQRALRDAAPYHRAFTS